MTVVGEKILRAIIASLVAGRRHGSRATCEMLNAVLVAEGLNPEPIDFQERPRRGRHVQRQTLPVKLRASIIARDGLRCGICGGRVMVDDVHVDHRLAVALGGTDDPANLRVTHSTCNLRKGVS